MIVLALVAAAAAAPLRYEDALQRAIDANPTLASGGAGVAAAEGALLAAQGAFDPFATGAFNTQRDLSQSSFLQGLTTENRAANWQMGVGSTLATGTTLGLDWVNTQSRTAYQGDAVRLDQLRAAGVLNEDYLYQSRLSARVSQDVLQGFKRSYNLSAVRQATRARDQAEAERLRTRNEVLAGVARAYWDLWYQRRASVIAEKSLEVAIEEQRIVSAKVAQGTLAPVEQARVDALVVQSRSALIGTRAAVRQASDLLLTLMGEAPGVDVEPTSEPAEVREAGVEVERAVEAALGNNPELQALRLTATNAELDLADARHQLLPNLSASGSYGLTGLETRDPDDPAGPFTAAGNLFNGEARNWSLGLNLTAPLGNRADRGLHAQRVAAAQQAGLGLKARELGLAQEVRAAAASLDTARAQLDLMGSNLALAEQTLAAERALADAGRSLQRDVLEAIRNVDEARVNLEKARADYLLAIIELERLKGSL